jgi:hypothetical protein
VLGQRVSAKIVGEIAPDGVDVIGPVLGVVVLDGEALADDAVVMPLAGLQAPHPDESELVPSPLFDPSQPLGGDGLALHLGVEPHEASQSRSLARVHALVGKPARIVQIAVR